MVDAHRPLDGKAALLMVILCALWGTQQGVIKLTVPEMPPLLQIGLRSGIAALAVLLLLLSRKEGHALRGRNRRPGLLAGVLFGLEFFFTGEGLRFTSASHMSIFLYTAPIFAAVGLQFRAPEERLTLLQWIGIAVAFAGVVLSFAAKGGTPEADATRFGDLLGICAGASWGASTLVVRTSRLARAPATVTLWYQLAGACALGVVSAIMLGQTTTRVTLSLLASIAYQGLVISAASYLVWFSLMRTYLTSRLGTLVFMTPIFGVGFGVVVLHDRLTPHFVLGAALILAGILLVSARDLLPRRSPRGTTVATPSHP